MLKAESVGPVDVAVVELGGDGVDQEVAAAILDLRDTGTVKVIDISFVAKSADGTVTITEVTESNVAEVYRGLVDDELDLLNAEDLELVGAELPPGSTAMVMVWENTWASRLSAALRRSGSRVRMLERVPRPVVQEAIGALEEDK
ncbi:hypothetical protein GCM10010468_14300 [Actinocorallia longicatena]|uniref:DUF1269 domain-containing protein n=2 Tax=Actinocorallia longicatena TaxID=111803 RepID=A0ABP6Q5M8_9ACTN